MSVKYGDTDSVYVEFNESGENGIASADELLKELNLSFAEFARQFGNIGKHFIRLKFEYFFKSIVFTSAKKRYIGLAIYKEGKKINELYSKGFENIRSDTALFFKKYLSKIFYAIVDLKSENEVNAIISEIIAET